MLGSRISDGRTTTPRSHSLDALPNLLLSTSGGQHPDATASEIADQFKHWRQVIDSLPLTSAEYLFATNWLTSAQNLWRRGEVLAARYQLSQILRRLRPELDEAAERVRKSGVGIQIRSQR